MRPHLLGFYGQAWMLGGWGGGQGGAAGGEISGRWEKSLPGFCIHQQAVIWVRTHYQHLIVLSFHELRFSSCREKGFLPGPWDENHPWPFLDSLPYSREQESVLSIMCLEDFEPADSTPRVPCSPCLPDQSLLLDLILSETRL